MKSTVVHVVSEVSDAPSFVWLARHGMAEGWRLVFILMNERNSTLEDQLRATGVEVRRVLYRGRRDYLRSVLGLAKIFRELRPRTVHTHLLGANLTGLLAAWATRVPNRIYTRHHSNWNEQGPWYASGYDHLANTLSTRIVATCQNVQTYLLERERVRPEKVKLVHLGFEIEEFKAPTPDRVARVKSRYGYNGRWPVIGLVSRYISCKGVPYAIAAFSELLEAYPNACLVLANAGAGGARQEIQLALSRLPNDAYREIAFESDCPALMRSFDVFVHVPVDPVSEAFGQVYVEALLNEVPSVTTVSGVAPEILRHENNTIVVPFRDASAIRRGVERLLAEPELRQQIAASGVVQAKEMFPMSRMIEGLRQIYV